MVERDFRAEVVPGLDYGAGDWWPFLLHYTTVWLATYLSLLGPMRAIWPWWRFNGGELVSLPRYHTPVRHGQLPAPDLPERGRLAGPCPEVSAGVRSRPKGSTFCYERGWKGV